LVTETSRSLSFVEMGRLGHHSWRHYVTELFVILGVWFGGSLFFVVPIFWVSDNLPGSSSDILSTRSIATFVLLNLTFLMLLLGIFLALRIVHKRPLLSVITPRDHINWRRIKQGFLLFLFFASLSAFGESLLKPGLYVVSLNLERFLPFALAMIVLTPIQTTSEELLFRGYLLQWCGLATKGLFVLGGLNGLLFMLPHLWNPEVESGFWLVMGSYFCIGTFLAMVTIRDGSAELAIGMHAANNLFTGLVANYENSALQTESIFLVTELDPTFGFIALVVITPVMYWILFGRQKATQPEAFDESDS